jgi:hypothetical protein
MSTSLQTRHRSGGRARRSPQDDQGCRTYGRRAFEVRDVAVLFITGLLSFLPGLKNHLGFYTVSREVLDTFCNERAPFRTSTTTLPLSAGKPLPASPFTRILRARIRENEQRAAEKKKYKM